MLHLASFLYRVKYFKFKLIYALAIIAGGSFVCMYCSNVVRFLELQGQIHTSLLYSLLALVFVFPVTIHCSFLVIFSHVLSSDPILDSDLLKWTFGFFYFRSQLALINLQDWVESTAFSRSSVLFNCTKCLQSRTIFFLSFFVHM